MGLKPEDKLAWPTRYQWRHFFKILSRNEQRLIGFLILLILLSSIIPARNFYLNHTEIGPTDGGAYTEAMIGAPRYLNPVLATANDVDRDISATIYSSLLKRNSRGNMMLDAAENHSVADQSRKIY